MAWKEHGVTDKNFSDEEFTLVKFAVDHELVEWGKYSEFAGYATADFKFLGREYEIQESFELVTSINRKEKS